jgi:hypothetical protein
MNFKLLPLCLLMLGCVGMDMRTMCEQSSDANLKDRCLSALALRDSNTALCKEIENATASDYCIMRIAIARLSEADCNDSTSLKEQCVRVVAGLRANSSLVCRLIEDNDTAELCVMRVM